MSVSVEIIPLADSLEMYGEPDTSAAYSLSGHVLISIKSTSSIFENRRPVRLLLRSLTLTFEGQSEVVMPAIGYASIRLCSLNQELAPDEPLELSNEGHEDSDKPCTWNIVFNLAVPGWLPATSSVSISGEDEARTRYSLFATAQFMNVDDTSDKTWSVSTLCSIFRPKTRVIRAPKCPITLRRYINVPPDSSCGSSFPVTNYAISAKAEYANATRDSSFIPLHVLSQIHLVISVPDSISVENSSFPFAIRLRTPDLDESERKRLRVVSFNLDIDQVEKYRSVASPEDLTCYPIPGPSSQPPNKPLLDPHHYHKLYQSGLVCTVGGPHQAVNRVFSVMPSDVSGTYQLAGDGYIFADESATSNQSTCYTIDTTVPFTRMQSHSHQLQVSSRSPLFSVRHKLRVAITCTYDIPNTTDRATERLHFSIPLRFVRIAPTSAYLNTLSPPSFINSDLSASPSTEMLTRSSPYAPNLPAYSQLFDSNGDRKIDYSVPLPLYTPQLSSSSTDHLQLNVELDPCTGQSLHADVLNHLPEEDKPLLADVSDRHI